VNQQYSEQREEWRVRGKRKGRQSLWMISEGWRT